MDNTYIIREAVPDDAEKMIPYLNQVGGESDYLLHGKNEFTVPVEGVRRKLTMSKVFSISVRKDCWNRGIGTELIKAVFEQAKKMNIRVIELEVITDNERGIHLYHKLGFADIGIYKDYFYVNGMFKDAVVMQKIL